MQSMMHILYPICVIFFSLFVDSYTRYYWNTRTFIKTTERIAFPLNDRGFSRLDRFGVDRLKANNYLISELDSLHAKSDGNSTELLMNIIRLGESSSVKNLMYFGSEETDNNNMDSSHISTAEMMAKLGLEKVTGCISNVWLGTKFNSNGTVTITGFADSKISRGLLHLIIEVLSSKISSDDVLKMNVAKLASHPVLGFLPSGRLNGFANMLKLVQDQIQRKLKATAPTNDSDVYHAHSTNREDVAVLLSGGVDSSLSLRLLKQRGIKVKAFYLKIWLEDEIAHLNQCPWEEDLSYAQAVATDAGVHLEAISLQKEYWREVVAYTLAEARAGRTPNPDIMCNSRIKFGMFYDYIGKNFNYIATGHYARAVRDPQDPMRRTRLMISPDPIKDQTYFLCNLRQDQLSRALFPVGEMTKAQVRELAKDLNLASQTRKDSQGICFLGKIKFDDFIGYYLGEEPGEIRCYSTNELLGFHKGLWYHTIGQRKGIGPLLLPKTVHRGPYFVAGKDIKTNTLFVTNQLDVVEKPRRHFSVQRLNWIGGCPEGIDSDSGIRLKMKMRHSPSFTEGFVRRPRPNQRTTSPSDNSDVLVEDTLEIVLDDRDKGIAPGQFAAFYDGDVCLGAGVISETLRD